MFSFKALPNLSLISLIFLLSACGNGDQKGGWKSKGGDKLPSPSFSSSAPQARASQEVFSAEERAIEINELKLDQDILFCAKKDEVNKSTLKKTYDNYGSLLGFKLQESIDRQTRLISLDVGPTLNNQSKFSDFQFLSNHKDPISQTLTILAGIEKLDPSLALSLEDILFNKQTLGTASLPPLDFYKKSNDGRSCYTSNFVSLDYSKQTYSINTFVSDSLSVMDKSLVLLESILALHYTGKGYLDESKLENFVFYLHTEDFITMSALTDESIKEQFQSLINTFFYAKTSAQK